FVPSMIERKQGHVVTIASSAGLVGVAKLADYCASKWAAVGFDESLRVEFKKYRPALKTTVVCPFFINTGMFDGVKTRIPLLLPILEEAYVVKRIVRAIERDTPRLVLPWFVRLTPLLKFFRPRSTTRSPTSSASTPRWTSSKAARNRESDALENGRRSAPTSGGNSSTARSSYWKTIC
ncbi:MAG: SDR family NAD(P)-dependent oxidoreductase, partial [Acidobacteria bacterium]|nr:SDR family NAD(P)-dependent oxidoreductase [Acidobacteriota bacterium]